MVARGTNFADVIAKQAKKLRAAMIVMGSHGRTGLQRFLLGSVAERTLRYADCPVLIVKK
jgi:nucleotide-binding universal stress UspA family protein